MSILRELRAAGWLLLAAPMLVGCGEDSAPLEPGPEAPGGVHSSSITLSSDGKRLFVANPDADSVSEIDVAARKLVQEIPLGARPAVAADGSYLPDVMPRALALSRDGSTLYVTGKRSGMLYSISTADDTVTGQVAVGSEPIGVLPSPDGKSVYVACSQDAEVVRVDASSLQVTGNVATPAKPWTLAFSNDDAALLVTHLLGAGVTAIDWKALSVNATWIVPDVAPRGDKRLAHGIVRGLYDVAPRPRSDELWVMHTLLGTDTAQPDLDFESTVFPAASILERSGALDQTLSINAQDVPGINGAYADVVSGPHAAAFTSDGKYALVVDTGSEDILAIDADQRVEASLLRPLPGHMQEGIVLAADDSVAFVDERNTGDVAVVAVSRDANGIHLAVDGDPIPRLSSDPMPKELRLGQHLFYSANSDEYPITTNHWVSCSSCHLEGRSDAVTWRFAQGPRDTPSNAGGMLNTGFLFRTADRNEVQDYFKTINIEQGGRFAMETQGQLLDAITAFVNHAIPLPVPPTTDPTLVAKGKEIFERPEVGCSSCHTGPRFTDSGAGNPKLDLAGTITLHDVGTCVKSPFPDVAHEDIEGHPRQACMFDTPSLSGVSDSAPYLHDGSAATLRDVLTITKGHMGDISSLSDDDLDALVEYLRSL